MRALLLPLSFAACAAAFAQTGDRLPLPAVPPPPPGMEAFDAALEPQITITRNDKETREEYRLSGKLYMVKVTPAGGGKPYYLLDREGNGQFIESDVAGPNLKPPMWLIHTW